MIVQLSRRKSELIDTLWNVNFTFQDAELIDAIELIDTLWNVNNSNTLV